MFDKIIGKIIKAYESTNVLLLLFVQESFLLPASLDLTTGPIWLIFGVWTPHAKPEGITEAHF